MIIKDEKKREMAIVTVIERGERAVYSL